MLRLEVTVYKEKTNVEQANSVQKNSLKSAHFFLHTRMIWRVFLIFITVFISLCATESFASSKKNNNSKSSENPKYAAIVMDAKTGEILMARHADSLRHPASLTKIMTLYMLFEAIDAGQIKMNDRIQISSFAAGKPPSKLGLPAGSTIRVEDAIKALVTRSANDIAAAIGEKISGSERKFAADMTARAKRLGMTRTVFRNASGLPDAQQVTTARDMARLSQKMLTDFPHYYHYFGVRNFEFRGANYHNHNRLLGSYNGLDGIKTGYINASGFNLVASAQRDGRRLIGIVFGGRTWKTRNDHMVKLLDQGFAEIAKRPRSQLQYASLSSRNAPVPLPPPMVDEIRGVPALALADENATDAGEEMNIQMDVAYAPIPKPAPTAVHPQGAMSGADLQAAFMHDTPMQGYASGQDNAMQDNTITAVPLPVPNPTLNSTLNPRAPNVQVAHNEAHNNGIDSVPLPAPMPSQRADIVRAPAPAVPRQTAQTAAPIPTPPPAPTFAPAHGLNRSQQVVAAVNAPTGVQQGAVQPAREAAPAPISAPRPAPRPPITAQMAPVGRGVQQPAQAAQSNTVMQLRIPREQLPTHMRPQANSQMGQDQRATASNIRSWAIQVGAFHSRAMTDEALRSAQSKLPTHLRHARPVIVPQNTGGTVLFRGRLQGFDELQANAACAHLGACQVVRPGS